MVTVFNVDSVGELIALAVWGMVVAGVQWAVFGSFWAGELATWVKFWAGPAAAEMGRLRWENQYGVRWDPRMDRMKPEDVMAAGEKLSASDRQANRKRFAALKRRSLHWRVMQYGLGCTGCQTFFSTLAVFAVVGWPGVQAAVLTAILFAGVAARRLPIPMTNKGDCGGKR